MLPSRAFGAPRPAVTYNVYDATNPDQAIKLTTTPLDVPKYADPRIVWGEQRCYTIVAAAAVEGVDDRKRAGAAGVRDADRYVSAGTAEGAQGDFERGRDQSDLGCQPDRRCRRLLVLRGVEPAETLAADHSGADRRAVVQ